MPTSTFRCPRVSPLHHKGLSFPADGDFREHGFEKRPVYSGKFLLHRDHKQTCHVGTAGAHGEVVRAVGEIMAGTCEMNGTPLSSGILRCCTMRIHCITVPAATPCSTRHSREACRNCLATDLEVVPLITNMPEDISRTGRAPHRVRRKDSAIHPRRCSHGCPRRTVNIHLQRHLTSGCRLEMMVVRSRGPRIADRCRRLYNHGISRQGPACPHTAARWTAENAPPKL